MEVNNLNELIDFIKDDIEYYKRIDLNTVGNLNIQYSVIPNGLMDIKNIQKGNDIPSMILVLKLKNKVYTVEGNINSYANREYFNIKLEEGKGIIDLFKKNSIGKIISKIENNSEKLIKQMCSLE